MVCAHQILFILHVTYGAKRTRSIRCAANGWRMNKKERRKKKTTQTKWKSHSGYLLCRAEIYIHHIVGIVTHCYIQSHVRSANRHTHTQCKIENDKNKRRRRWLREWRHFYLFQSTNSRSRDNINIKFIYPLQIWCDVFFFFSTLHFHHIIIRYLSYPRWSSLNWVGSMREAWTVPQTQIHT